MLELTDVTATGKLIAEIDGKNYRLLFREDGYWKADMVEPDQYGNWMVCDDDLWMIDRSGKIAGREVGWERRFVGVEDGRWIMRKG